MKINGNSMRNSRRPAAVILLLAAALGSCSKEPAEPFAPETYIGFGLPAVSMSGPEISDMDTRGTIYNAFPDGESFGVLGYLKSNDANAAANWATKYLLLRPDVFDRRVVTYQDGACSYAGLEPWRDERSETANLYTFFAYYPSDAFTIESSNADGAGAPLLTYTMPFSGNNLSLDSHTAVDAMVAVKYDHTKVMGNVDFTFSHLMTAIRFKVNNYDGSTPLRINSISLAGNFYRSTTLDYTPVAQSNNLKRTTSGTYNGTYSVYNDSNNPFTVAAGTSLFVGEGEGSIILLLPGIDSGNSSVRGLGPDVSFSCEYIFMNDFAQNGGGSLDYSFEPGTLYTINLNFIGDSFTINITSDNWENGSDNDIIIQ